MLTTSLPDLRRSAEAIPYLESVRDRLDADETLPAEWYWDQSIYELERHTAFSLSWQLVGLSLDVAEPGDFIVVPVDEYRDFLVTRDRDGRLRGFHNVCAHRGSPLVHDRGSGTASAFQCSYHGWTYALDGRLLKARLMDADPDFDPSDFHLAEVSVAEWEPFLFLNVDPEASPLERYLGDLPATIASLGVDMAAIARDARRAVFDTYFESNWKLAVENSLECYHCPVAHPGLAATIDIPQWHISMGGNCIVQGTRMRAASSVVPEKAGRLGPRATQVAYADDGMDLALFHWIFPNASISVWPGPGNSFTIGRFIPWGPGRTRRWSVRWWGADTPQEVAEEQQRFILEVAMEDKAIIERLQRGVRSGGWRGGRFQLVSERNGEHGIQRFNRLLLDSMLA